MIDRKQFAQRVIREFRKCGETRPMLFDAEKFAITIGEPGADNALIANLHNIYSACNNAPVEHHEAMIAHHTKIMVKRRDTPKDYSAAQSRLGVSIKHAGEVEQIPGWVHRHLASDISMVLVDDDGDSLASVLEASCHNWKVDPEACIAQGIRNLMKLPWPLVQIGQMFRSRADDSYDAARILLQEHIRQIPVKGDPVALVPDRECLVITGSEDIDGLKQLAATGHVRFEEASRHISGVPLILRDGGWQTFDPPGEARATFEHLAKLFDAIHYGQQTSFLREQNSADGKDVFVPDIRVFKTGAERYETFACFPSNGPILLPKVDRVALCDLQTGAIQVTSWDDLSRVFAGQMAPMTLHPVRYRVARFPSAAERQEMGGTIQEMNAHPTFRSRMRPR